ncbi:O-antigen acetylase [Legionella nautarum]|uniref:O-antigen acetylase n=1 Tax=Legionella nautarum TaxID=45070 RepID=A0A0W0X443_9GAMM|nr:acyltransferase family protein [Legionella nautarum]KTD39329.1 O-antigen acetylase [Legionella nautarum]
MSHSQYRPDIDGLRAIAVLSVVCFHAFPTLLKGGFVGVDIFFVISGFLISKIILENLANNSFSFVDFYSRRIKRIFPALIFVLISCYIFGWFMLLGDEYKQLGKHMASCAGFISNFTFWGEAGYFDNVAETKPFLHLWSLAIEEQFYIIWPLLLWLAYKRKSNLLILTLIIISISFGFNVANVHRHRIEVFYSPISRFWELLTGALLAYLSLNPIKWTAILKFRFHDKNRHLILAHEQKTLAHYQSLFGFILISLALLLIDKRKNFPGWWALLPCIGSFHIIAAGPQAWLNRIILSNPIMRWLGLISYPLYLWHWPLLSFGHIFLGELIPTKISLILIAFSIVFAWLTYQFIEKPLRFSRQSKVKVGLVFTIFLIGFLGYQTDKYDGFLFRLKDRGEYADFFENSYPRLKYIAQNKIGQKYRNECNFYDVDAYEHEHATMVPMPSIAKSCQTAKTELSIFLWGDSHAQHLYYGLAKTLPNDISILQVASSACQPAWVDRPLSKNDNYCIVSNKVALDTVRKQHPQIVIFAQATNHENNADLDKLIMGLKNTGIENIFVLGPVPQWNIALHKLVLNKYWHYVPKRITQDNIRPDVLSTEWTMKKKYMNAANGIHYVSLWDFFCNRKGCISYVNGNKREGLVTWDIAHLSPLASLFLAKGLLQPLILSKLQPYREQIAARAQPKTLQKA